MATILNASAMKTGKWDHYINDTFDENQGSWSSNEDSSYRGFWRTTSSWSDGRLGTADVYLDSNLNGSWDAEDELIGDVEGFWDGSYSGGSWNRIEGLKNGYYGGSAFGSFRITSQMTFDATNSDDLFAGSEGGDQISALDGNDEIYSSKGDDNIKGNMGDDIIYGGNGFDFIYGGKGSDAVYGNLDNDKLYGNIGNDYLYGGQGDDVIYAGQGDDYVYGNKGNDTLYGNKGADTFVCTKGFDVIKDFWGLDGDKISVTSVAGAVISERDGSTLITSGEGQLLLEGFARQFFDESQYLV